MTPKRPAPHDVDAYLQAFPADVQALLARMRATLRQAAPHAEEFISYGMPAYRQHGMLAYFAAFKQHIGFYPPVAGDPQLAREAAPYAGEKGNLRFPYAEAIPYDLVDRIVRHRLAMNLAKAAGKKPAKPAAKTPARPAAKTSAKTSAKPAAKKTARPAATKHRTASAR